jgi:hypothetical protein
MRKAAWLTACAIGALSGGIASAPAWADTATATASDATSTTVADIVVTANKRE